jgi:hypothetical protein
VIDLVVEIFDAFDRRQSRRLTLKLVEPLEIFGVRPSTQIECSKNVERRFIEVRPLLAFFSKQRPSKHQWRFSRRWNLLFVDKILS